jgi:hypothetical protein
MQPTTLQLGDATQGPAGVSKVKSLKSLPAQFNSEGLIERQFQATSEDGTQIPYFLVSHKDMPLDGSTPCLLYGYGGFEISLPPVYSGVVGAGWLDTTGETTSTPTSTFTSSTSASASASTSASATSASTPPAPLYRCYVMANIRGGGEFGPAWHQAALRENRKLAYDDFIAVAEDLIKVRLSMCLYTYLCVSIYMYLFICIYLYILCIMYYVLCIIFDDFIAVAEDLIQVGCLYIQYVNHVLFIIYYLLYIINCLLYIVYY